eukprot:3420061-Amphidinium_carterae.5
MTRQDNYRPPHRLTSKQPPLIVEQLDDASIKKEITLENNEDKEEKNRMETIIKDIQVQPWWQYEDAPITKKLSYCCPVLGINGCVVALSPTTGRSSTYAMMWIVDIVLMKTQASLFSHVKPKVSLSLTKECAVDCGSTPSAVVPAPIGVFKNALAMPVVKTVNCFRIAIVRRSRMAIEPGVAANV